MSRQSRRGFTLIEVLVVIAIIAMLAGLLLPAINAARLRARAAECQNNCREIALSIKTFETTKGRLPGLVNPQPGAPTQAVGWAPVLFPYMDQMELFKLISSNQALPNTTVKLLVCPGDSLKTAPFAMSYAANSGRVDATASTGPPPIPSAAMPADYPANGVFMNVFNGYCQPIDSTFISRHDGAANTILFSENVDATVWWDTGATRPNCPNEGFQDIVWSPTNTPSVGLNKNIGQGTGANARPSSAHSTGFNVAMCDGSVRLMSEDIQYRVYAMLMTPDGNNAKDPGTGTATSFPTTAPLWTISGAATGTLIPLTAADLEP